jgi:hypothetical protein
LFDLPARSFIYYLNEGEAKGMPKKTVQGPKPFWEFMQDEYKRYLPLAVKMGMRK